MAFISQCLKGKPKGISEMEKTDIKSLTLDELKEYMTSLGEKPYRARQLYEWMHVHLCRSYDEMSNLPAKLLNTLRENTDYVSLQAADCQISRTDGTRKYLFELGDKNYVESVLMRYHYGLSVCISSQVGCRMGCRF